MLPLFFKLAGRRAVVIGAGRVALAKIAELCAAEAEVHVIAPRVLPEIAALAAAGALSVERRAFVPEDLDGAWLAVAAATPAVNAAAAQAAEARRVWINVVDDPAQASAYFGSTLRRDGVVIAFSTEGRAPALAALLREGFEALLPAELGRWFAESDRLRGLWRASKLPFAERRPALLAALNRLYAFAETKRAPEAPAKSPPSTIETKLSAVIAARRVVEAPLANVTEAPLANVTTAPLANVTTAPLALVPDVQLALAAGGFLVDGDDADTARAAVLAGVAS